MRARPASFPLLALSLLALLGLGGCGVSGEETEVNEGEPLELGDLSFNVQITRFLNPSSTEDSAYLEGAPELAQGQQFLAVFMQVDNEGESPNVVPYPIKIIDTRGNVYVQAKVDNDFALVPGTPVEPDESLPGPETAARNGPIQGSMILFPIPESATENRPLQLEVPGPGEVGKIELDL